MSIQLGLQFVGALAILVPFALLQVGRTRPHAYGYLVANLVGAGVLTVLAVVEAQWGFVILQGVWALASLRGLLRTHRSRAASGRVPPAQ